MYGVMNELSDDQVYWWRALEDGDMDTRGKILQAAYREIHVHGFQAASLNHILARAGVTKGALYYHFPNKLELGYAVVDEVIARRIDLSFVRPLASFDDPIDGLIELIQSSGDSFSMTDIELGCPLTVLAQEMAPIDEGFRGRLVLIYENWHQSLADVFIRASEDGLLKDDVDPYTLAVTVAATLEGSLSVAKVARNLDMLYYCGCGMIQYLNLIKK